LTRSSRYPGVDLSLVELQDPDVPAPECVRDTVVCARDQIVSVAGLGVPDLPPAVQIRPPAPPDLELERVPVIWREAGRGVELANLVVLGGADVELEPPVDVVVGGVR
jgi:hypothetical protein